MTGNAEHDSPECMEFKKRLDEGFELGSAIFIDPHLMSCSRCQELVAELEEICKEARDFQWRHE